LNSWNDDECAIKCETILDPETNQTYSQLFKVILSPILRTVPAI